MFEELMFEELMFEESLDQVGHLLLLGGS